MNRTATSISSFFFIIWGMFPLVFTSVADNYIVKNNAKTKGFVEATSLLIGAAWVQYLPTIFPLRKSKKKNTVSNINT